MNTRGISMRAFALYRKERNEGNIVKGLPSGNPVQAAKRRRLNQHAASIEDREATIDNIMGLIEKARSDKEKP